RRSGLLRGVHGVFERITDVLGGLLARGDRRVELLARGVAVSDGLGDLDDAVPQRSRHRRRLRADEGLGLVDLALDRRLVPDLAPLRLDLLVAPASGARSEYVTGAESDDTSDLPLHGVASRCSGRAAGEAPSARAPA